ncbi:MAG: tetratricopeptide (TPR) repeat protein [Chlamydiales bacterium]|jgi:tetratricopeptide (TPR) repeat protein
MKWTTFSGLVVVGSAALFFGRKVLLPTPLTTEQVLLDVEQRSKQPTFRERDGLRDLERAMEQARLAGDEEMGVRLLALHANILRELGAYPEAQADVRKILRRFLPKDPDFECYLAELRFLDGEPEQGLALVTGLLRRHPEHGKAWRLRGQIEEVHARRLLVDACEIASETLLTGEALSAAEILRAMSARSQGDPERTALVIELRELFLPRFEHDLIRVLEAADGASMHFTKARYSLANSFKESFEPGAVETFMELTQAAGRLDLAADFGLAVLEHPELKSNHRLLNSLFKTLETLGRKEQLDRLLAGIDWAAIEGDIEFFTTSARGLYYAMDWNNLITMLPRMARLAGAAELSYTFFYQGVALAEKGKDEGAGQRLNRYLKQTISHEPIPGALGIAAQTMAGLEGGANIAQERWALERAVLYGPESSPESYLRLVKLQIEDRRASYGLPEARWTKAMSLMPERTEELAPFWAELGTQSLTARGRDFDSLMEGLRESGAAVPTIDLGPYTLYRVGRAHLADERPVSAIKVAGKLLEDYPGLLPALDLSIDAHLAREQIDLATELILERLATVGRDSKTTDYLEALGDQPFEDQQVLDMMLADPARTGRLMMARYLLEHGSPERALRALQREDPESESAEVRFVLVEALLALERFEEATELLHGLVDDPAYGPAATVRLMLSLFRARDVAGLAEVVETRLAIAAKAPEALLEVVDTVLALGRPGQAKEILRMLDAEADTRSGGVLWRMALAAALEEDVLGALEALERAQAYLPDGRVELARLIFAVESRDWTALAELVAELRETGYAPSPLVNTILTVLEERLDAASAMAENGLQQNPRSADWALVMAADRLLDGRPFELSEYFGPDILEETTRLLRGHGEIARDPREVLGFLLARELPGWEIWTYRGVSRLTEDPGNERWARLLRAQALAALGQADAAAKALKFLTVSQRTFGPAWDLYEELRRAAHPADPYASELVELRRRRRRALGEELSGSPLEVWVDRAASQFVLQRYSATRTMLRTAYEEAGPDSAHGRDLMARTEAALGQASAAVSEYLLACEGLPRASGHPLVAEFLDFLEEQAVARRPLSPEEVDFALERLHQRFPLDPLISLAQTRRILLKDDGPHLAAGFASNRLRALRKGARGGALDSLRPGSGSAWAELLLEFTPEGAENLLREELVITPGNLDLWLLLAECVRVRGRTDDALSIYRQLVEMSEDGQAHLALAWMLADGGATPSEVKRHLTESSGVLRPDSARTTFIQLRSRLQSPSEPVAPVIRDLTALWDARDGRASEVPLNELGMTYASALIRRSTREDEKQLQTVLETLAGTTGDPYERDVLRSLGALAKVVARDRAKAARAARRERNARRAAHEAAKGGAAQAAQPEGDAAEGDGQSATDEPAEPVVTPADPAGE